MEAAVEADLTAYLEQADRHGKTRAVLVYHRGEPVLERYTGATEEDYWDLQSVTTSVVGTLIGIAIGQGHLTASTRLSASSSPTTPT